jgi:hypothetical protein
MAAMSQQQQQASAANAQSQMQSAEQAAKMQMQSEQMLSQLRMAEDDHKTANQIKLLQAQTDSRTQQTLITQEHKSQLKTQEEVAKKALEPAQ